MNNVVALNPGQENPQSAECVKEMQNLQTETGDEIKEVKKAGWLSKIAAKATRFRGFVAKNSAKVALATADLLDGGVDCSVEEGKVVETKKVFMEVVDGFMEKTEDEGLRVKLAKLRELEWSDDNFVQRRELLAEITGGLTNEDNKSLLMRSVEEVFGAKIELSQKGKELGNGIPKFLRRVADTETRREDDQEEKAKKMEDGNAGLVAKSSAIASNAGLVWRGVSLAIGMGTTVGRSVSMAGGAMGYVANIGKDLRKETLLEARTDKADVDSNYKMILSAIESAKVEINKAKISLDHGSAEDKITALQNIDEREKEIFELEQDMVLMEKELEEKGLQVPDKEYEENFLKVTQNEYEEIDKKAKKLVEQHGLSLAEAYDKAFDVMRVKETNEKLTDEAIENKGFFARRAARSTKEALLKSAETLEKSDAKLQELQKEMKGADFIKKAGLFGKMVWCSMQKKNAEELVRDMNVAVEDGAKIDFTMQAMRGLKKTGKWMMIGGAVFSLGRLDKAAEKLVGGFDQILSEMDNIQGFEEGFDLVTKATGDLIQGTLDHVLDDVVMARAKGMARGAEYVWDNTLGVGVANAADLGAGVANAADDAAAAGVNIDPSIENGIDEWTNNLTGLDNLTDGLPEDTVAVMKGGALAAVRSLLSGNADTKDIKNSEILEKLKEAGLWHAENGKKGGISAIIEKGEQIKVTMGEDGKLGEIILLDENGAEIGTNEIGERMDVAEGKYEARKIRLAENKVNLGMEYKDLFKPDEVKLTGVDFDKILGQGDQVITQNILVNGVPESASVAREAVVKKILELANSQNGQADLARLFAQSLNFDAEHATEKSAQIAEFVSKFKNGELKFPEISEGLPSNAPDGTMAAYDSVNNKILVSPEFLELDESAKQKILLEEWAHWVDDEHVLKGIDAQGDEGEKFADLATGQDLKTGESAYADDQFGKDGEFEASTLGEDNEVAEQKIGTVQNDTRNKVGQAIPLNEMKVMPKDTTTSVYVGEGDKEILKKYNLDGIEIEKAGKIASVVGNTDLQNSVEDAFGKNNEKIVWDKLFDLMKSGKINTDVKFIEDNIIGKMDNIDDNVWGTMNIVKNENTMADMFVDLAEKGVVAGINSDQALDSVVKEAFENLENKIEKAGALININADKLPKNSVGRALVEIAQESNSNNLTQLNLSANDAGMKEVSGKFLTGDISGESKMLLVKGSNLSETNIKLGTDLSGSVFEKSNLGTNMTGVKLENAIFDRSVLDGANFSNADLTGSTFKNLTLENVNLSGADLTNVAFENVTIGKGVIIDGNTNMDSDLRAKLMTASGSGVAMSWK